MLKWQTFIIMQEKKKKRKEQSKESMISIIFFQRNSITCLFVFVYLVVLLKNDLELRNLYFSCGSVLMVHLIIND